MRINFFPIFVYFIGFVLVFVFVLEFFRDTEQTVLSQTILGQARLEDI